MATSSVWRAWRFLALAIDEVQRPLSPGEVVAPPGDYEGEVVRVGEQHDALQEGEDNQLLHQQVKDIRAEDATHGASRS